MAEPKRNKVRIDVICFILTGLNGITGCLFSKINRVQFNHITVEINENHNKDSDIFQGVEKENNFFD
jgi:phosphoribosylaminoimidazole (AIR) synthetase